MSFQLILPQNKCHIVQLKILYQDDSEFLAVWMSTTDTKLADVPPEVLIISQLCMATQNMGN